jgi:hypothetical protein
MKLTADFSQAARLKVQLCGMLLRTEMSLLEPYLFMNVSCPSYWFYNACRTLASFRINFQVLLFLSVFLQINGYTIQHVDPYDMLDDTVHVFDYKSVSIPSCLPVAVLYFKTKTLIIKLLRS